MPSTEAALTLTPDGLDEVTKECGDRHDFRGPIQGAQARRLMARVQQRGWQRLPSPSVASPPVARPRAKD